MTPSAAFDSSTSAKPTLENLPTEMVETIVHELDEQDLFAFRLVSTPCANKSAKIFAKTWWTEIKVRLFDKPNIESAIAHLDHSVYGPAARKIIIYIDEWSVGDTHPFRTLPPTLATKEAISAAIMYQDYARVRGQPFLVQLLKPIFYRLVLFGRVDEVCIAWGGLPIIPRASCPKLPKKSFQHVLSKYWGPPDTHDGLAFLSILEAMSASCFRPMKLTMRKVSEGKPRVYGLADCRWGVLLNNLLEGPTPLYMKDIFQNLTMLQLDVWTPKFDTPYPSVFETIAAIPNLTHLDLTIHNPTYLGTSLREMDLDANDQRPTDSFLRNNFPALKTLELYGARCSVDSMVDFIRRHMSIELLGLQSTRLTHWPLGGWDNRSQLVNGYWLSSVGALVYMTGMDIADDDYTTALSLIPWWKEWEAQNQGESALE